VTIKEGNVEEAPEVYSEAMTWDLHLDVGKLSMGDWVQREMLYVFVFGVWMQT
jgi:hypothetical protein